MTISRRSLLSGAGALGGAVVLGDGGPAGAAPTQPDVTATPQATPPGIVSISSPPEPGVSYRFASWVDCTPLNNLSNGRFFGSKGVYPNVGQDVLGTTFEVPSGALVHDVEVYCSAPVNTNLSLATWSSGVAQLGNPLVEQQIGPFSSTAIRATRVAVPTSVNGPFPHGTKLAVYLDTLTNGKIALNGFRLGLRNVPRGTVLLPAPIRVYDSGAHRAPLHGGQTRTFSLASHLPVGASGALYTLSVNNTHGHGVLQVGAAGSALTTIGLQWSRTGDRVSTPVTTAVSSARSISVRSRTGSGPTDFLLDLTGYLV